MAHIDDGSTSGSNTAGDAAEGRDGGVATKRGLKGRNEP